MTSLLIVLSDSLSDLQKKGETITRYYNPGDLFNEVHFLLTYEDHPDIPTLQYTVGSAKIFVHILPIPSIISTLYWQPFMLQKWLDQGLEIAQKIQPSLIRAYGNGMNGFLAAHIRKQINVPFVVSLHANPDVDSRRIKCTNPTKHYFNNIIPYLVGRKLIFFENETLKMADYVLPVYDGSKRYAIEHGARRVKVCYNVINPEYLRVKKTYSLHSPPRIISVGRLHPCKNPENLIRAVSKIPDIHLTIVGKGEIHEYLVNVANKCNISNRVEFISAISNDELCRSLPEYDIFAVHNEYWGISKAVIEALLTGLPVIHNKRIGDPVLEFDENFMCLVENTVEGYYNALQKMLTDDKYREQIGKNANSHAQLLWSPEKTEAAYVEVYQNLLSEKDTLDPV